MKRNNIGHKWILIEAIVCTLPAVVLLISALPLISFGVIELIVPIAEDRRSNADRFIALIPYLGGIFGVTVLWWVILTVVKDKSVHFDFIVFAAFIAGFLASYELYSVAPIVVQIIVLLPLWALVGHLFLLKKPALN